MESREWYGSDILNMIVECVEESEERFMSEWDYTSTLQTLLLLIDKFSIDKLLEEYHFSEYEYKKYFKDYTKQYDIDLHKTIKQEFKNKENGYES